MAARKAVVLVLVVVAAAVIVSLGSLILLVLAAGAPPAIARDSTLVLRLRGPLAEHDPGPFGQFFRTQPSVRAVVDSLRRAKTDGDVAGVVLAPGGGEAFWGKVQEIREAVLDFRTSGKPIIGFLEYGGQQEFYLASACDRVFLLPTSSLDLTGLASYEVFLRGALDKIGAQPDMLHVGEFKSAANTYMETGFTPQHREMARSLNADLFDQIVRGIAEGRGKSPEQVRELFAHGPFLAADALEAGLVDGLAYEDELHEQAGFTGDPDDRVDLDDYRRADSGNFRLGAPPRLALIYTVGVIASGHSGEDPLSGPVVGSDTLAGYLRRAREDRSVRAIVLRIDSPGGSAIASEVIWREMQLARASKPVVVSMGDVAASGGYYIAMPAHAIVAQPATLTGSIGVVQGKIAIGGTLDRLGIGLEPVSEGPYAEIASPLRPFTPEERARLLELMQATYEAFVRKAADGRGTTYEAIEAIARGRVWTGRQAKDLRLVDELGGLSRALTLAKTRAGLDADAAVQLVVYPPRRTLLDALVNPFGAGAAGLFRLPGAGLDPRVVGRLTAPWRLFRRGEPLALTPTLVQW